ncbi:ISL3 family transposase [Akkermansiaceae bacterium]|nr:ISL3 family transposase [Akkermansiaceae bacterium]
MQSGTYLHSKSPRIKCEQHVVKTMSLPWAAKHSGFTLLFEAFAIRVIQASRSTQAAGDLLGINRHQIQTIMERAVGRGLARREPGELAWIGMEHLSDEAPCRIRMSGGCELGVSKAWCLKELFKRFWNRRDRDDAERHLEYWEKEVASSGVDG